MKNKKLIGLLLIVLVALVVATTATISAWLTDTKTTDPTTFTIGEVKYDWSGTLVESPVVPGQNLIATTYKLTNDSNVQSELRVKISATTNQPDVGTDALSLLLFGLDQYWVKSGDYWYYQGVTGVLEDEVTKYKIPAGTQALDVLLSLKIDGSKVGNNYRNKTMTVSFTFEAKQSDYVTWEQLGTANIDFSTGLSS